MTNKEKTTCGEYMYVYTAYITTKSGFKIYARNRGLKAFRIRVKIKN
jgi:hypothetical protein